MMEENGDVPWLDKKAHRCLLLSTDRHGAGGRAVAVLREWRSEDPFLLGKSFTFMLY